MDKDSAEEEFEISKSIKTFDPNGDYTILPEVLCPISRNISIKNIGECDVPNIEEYKNENKFKQLIIKDGGIDLHYIHNNYTKLELEQIIELYKNLPQLSDIYKVFLDNNFIHGDVKPSNIMYNFDEHKYRVIDFGLSSKLEKATFEEFINNPEIDRQFYENIIRHYENKHKYVYQPTNEEMKINIESLNNRRDKVRTFNSVTSIDAYGLGKTAQEVFCDTNLIDLLYKELQDKLKIELNVKIKDYFKIIKEEIEERIKDPMTRLLIYNYSHEKRGGFKGIFDQIKNVMEAASDRDHYAHIFLSVNKVVNKYK